MPVVFAVDKKTGGSIKRLSELDQSFLAIFNSSVMELFVRRRSKLAKAFRNQLRICIRVILGGLGAGGLGVGGFHCPRGECLARCLVCGFSQPVSVCNDCNSLAVIKMIKSNKNNCDA